jgi:hypothetical protein
MKNLILWACGILMGVGPVAAQGRGAEDPHLSKQQQEVMHVIDRLFDAMRTNDGPLAASLFTENARLYTSIVNKEGLPVLEEEMAKKFIEMIGQPKNVVLDEPLWDWEVRIDGTLAQVWTKYAFFAGDRFSHCGVDAFHLHKTEEGWKIFHVTDTRQKEGCVLPEAIKNRKK